ncbi:hypothetical protein C6P46_003329 [Rhodotorula mucilaginosa]|uniref:GRF-type domain-containing protein n=1 Tax=Rhodotorula mucilaginosa TaxID=5537 RepID=A0A9P6W2U5_RHOMI|nr:hypothetical protein C6P46_003329 [Rhodotorula mucilaginosa]
MQAPVATRARTAAPTRRTDAAALRDFHCFQPNGDVWCFCNTEPRIKAIRRVTRKESSPNLGREFWSCGNWVEGEACGFFLWSDQAQRMGRTFVTPPPPHPQSYVQLTDAQRRRPSPAPFSAAPPLAVKGTLPLSPTSSPVKRTHAASSSQQQQRTAQEVIDSFEDVELSEFEPDDDDDDREDEILNDDDNDDTAPWTASPPKKARFDSFAAPASPRTPNKHNAPAPSASSSSSSTFAAIRADPDSPFHAIQRSLFSAAAAAESTTTSSTPPNPNGLKAAQPTTASTTIPGDAFSSLAGALAPLAALLDAAQKERDKDARLLVAAKRKEETLRRSYEKERDERERLRTENEGLKNRIKLLEHEMLELRLRKP